MEIMGRIYGEPIQKSKGRVYGDSWSHRLKAKVRAGRISRMSGRRSGKHIRPW